MANIDWKLDAVELVTCNCDYSCPCQFNAPPTYGDCRATGAYRIARGHFGDTVLDGIVFAALWAWPGPIHDGKGEAQLIIDDDATDEQAFAVESLFNGEHTEPGATIFNVFSNVIDTYYPVLRRSIEFEADIEERTGRFRIDGIVEGHGEPIRNPVTGLPHRARVTLPHGFEYHDAEYASCSVKTESEAKIPLDYSHAHAHFAQLHWTAQGPAHE